MSTQLTLGGSLVYGKNNISISFSLTGVTASVGGNGLASNTAYTATTSDTALPLGSVTAAGGWLFVYNTDLTNYVNIKTAVSGTVIATVKAGEFALFRLPTSVTAPSVQANTASCILQYAIFDL